MSRIDRMIFDARTVAYVLNPTKYVVVSIIGDWVLECCKATNESSMIIWPMNPWAVEGI